MRTLLLSFLFLMLLSSCEREFKQDPPQSVDWNNRQAVSVPDSLMSGTTYLSVYSQIYSFSEHKTHDLTVTVGIRNTSTTDTLFLDKADYFDTEGARIREYVKQTIVVRPLETIETIIGQSDKSGGTGANFLFDWRINPETTEPIFEAVMISTAGQQGLSFSTQGKRIK